MPPVKARLLIQSVFPWNWPTYPYIDTNQLWLRHVGYNPTPAIARSGNFTFKVTPDITQPGLYSGPTQEIEEGRDVLLYNPSDLHIYGLVHHASGTQTTMQ